MSSRLPGRQTRLDPHLSQTQQQGQRLQVPLLPLLLLLLLLVVVVRQAIILEQTTMMERINLVKLVGSFLLDSNVQLVKVFGIAPKNVKPLTGRFITENARK